MFRLSAATIDRLVNKFTEELTEAMVIVLVIHVVADKPLEPMRVLRIALTLAMIITALEEYRPTLSEKIKEGVRFTAGASIVS